jgi:hypothetical protein
MVLPCDYLVIEQVDPSYRKVGQREWIEQVDPSYRKVGQREWKLS